MKLVGLKLKNFRRYKDNKFDLSQNLHMIVGNNDIGKSTILEALDIFFNDKSAINKLCFSDLNKQAKDNGEFFISITCLFEFDNNEKVTIDSQYLVSPQDEYLLNKDGLLEIIKTYDCNTSTLKQSISIVGAIPNCIDKSIITKKQMELKTYLNEILPNSDVDKRINSHMRLEIYKKMIADNPNYEIEEQTIDTKSILSDKDFYPNLEKSFPDYYLFKADRANNTSDSEVQNPLSIAVKDVLNSDEIKQKLAEVEDIVKKHINEVNAATIEQMRKFSTRLGNNLEANLSTNWIKAINNDISDSNEIPINKKGSGIRRLLLLSYLMVDANRKSFINNNKNIIYAIEEPETALHPKLQIKFIRELYSMANRHSYLNGEEIPTNQEELNNYKVLLTTHTPNYLAYATQDEVIYLSEDENLNVVELNKDAEIEKIKNEMGLLPNPNYSFIIFVEGDSDISFLRNLGNIPELKEIFDINDRDVNIIALKGSNLLNGIEKDFYKDLPVKQFHLYDGDRAEYKKFIEEKVNGQNIKWKGFVTERKEIEYYIPTILIECRFGIDMGDCLDKYDNKDFDLINYILTRNSNCPVLQGIKTSKNSDVALKNYLNKTVLKAVTKEQLTSFNVYEEIRKWFLEMKKLKELQPD